MPSRAATITSTSAVGVYIDTVVAATPDLHPTTIAGYRAFQREIESIKAQTDAVKTSNELTYAGKINRLTDLQRKGLAVLKPNQESLAKADKMIADLIATALQARKPKDEDGRSRQREIRDRLAARNAGPLEILPMLLEAIGRADSEFVDAVMGAPLAFPLVNEEGRRAAVNATIATSPDLSAQLRGLEETRSVLAELIATARVDIEAAVSFGTPGPRAQGSTGIPGSDELIIP